MSQKRTGPSGTARTGQKTKGVGTGGDYSKIGELDKLPQWVAWREELRHGVQTKVPYCPHTGRKASSTNPRQWGTRRQAEERAKADGLKGVGIMLGALQGHAGLYLGGVDLDTCRDGETIAPWAQEVIDRFNTEAEVSPSDTGVKLYFFREAKAQPAVGPDGKLGKVFKRRGDTKHAPGIEIYLGGRFFAVTDNHLSGSLRTVPREDVEWLLREAGPAFASNGSPSTSNSRDGSRSAELYRLAREIKLRGGTPEEFAAAIPDNLAAAGHVAEQADPQRAIDRAWEAAPDAAVTKFKDESGNDDLLGPKKAEPFAGLADVADAFRNKYAGKLLYCKTTRRWYAWNGDYWRPDNLDRAYHYASEECRREGGNDLSRAKSRAQGATAVEKLARADPAFVVEADHFDRDPFLLGTPGGVVNLRTGELRRGRPEDYITRVTAVTPIPLDEFDPERDCPLWLKFLREATDGDGDLIRFSQQWFGYNLTADVREEKIVFYQGLGGGGKSTLLGAVSNVSGDYGRNIPVGVLTERTHEQHPTEIAQLLGRRLVWCSETPQDKYWNQQRLTEWTGGDKISGRFMRGDFFDFLPTHKLTAIGNHRPRIRNVNDAIRRRFVVVPFNHLPKVVNVNLKDELRKEYPGILSWMIAGCRDWQENGFTLPKVVAAYTTEYLQEQDSFARWLGRHCKVDKSLSDTTENLWDSWSRFAESEGENPGSKFKTFPERLSEHGFTSKRIGATAAKGWSGLRAKELSD